MLLHVILMKKKAVKAIKKNSKFFFSYAKRFSKKKSNVGPLKVGSNVTADNKEMANILASQFSSVFCTSKNQLPSADELFSNMSVDSSSPSLNQIPFDENDFLEALDALKSSSGSGPYGFPSIYLKHCKLAFARPLYILWKMSMQSGVIPTRLKTTYVTPLFKKGSPGLPENYRPIANSSHLIKVFEKVIRKYMVAYLDENNLFNPNQHGFRHNHSCLSQLLAHYEEVLSCIEEGLGVDVIYLDFSKAFDKVNFNVLFHKLKSLGVDGKLGKWLYAFLTNRTQTVLVNGVHSIPFLVLSGVPQGSVLGPLLFLILIADIDKNLDHCLLSSFADDTRVNKSISSSLDMINMQSNLDKIFKWADDNKLSFNGDKFELLRYNVPSSLSSFQYKDCDNLFIEEKQLVTDLGIEMSNNAKFTAHIQSVCSSMKNMSSWILRTFRSRSREVMLTTWKTLVLPIHDYCSQLWSPHKVGEIQKFELLQWYFLKKTKHCYFTDYWDALNQLNMLSLQRRRERYQIIYVWKILENIVPNPVIKNELSNGNLINSIYSSRRGRSCVIPPLNSHSSVAIKNICEQSFHVHWG